MSDHGSVSSSVPERVPEPGPGAERRPVARPRPGPDHDPAPRTASAPPPSFDVAVVGGGLLGCAVALFLSRGGMRAALVERGGLCREASGVNAGTLTMQMTRAALIPYALEAHRMWTSARKWLGHDVGVTACDGLSLAFTEGEAALLEERVRARREAGAPIRLLGLEAARRVEPGLSRWPVLASHCPVDGFASAYLTGLAFRRALVGAGAQVFEHCPAAGVEADAGGGYVVRLASPRQPRIEARRLVLAGGAWLGKMAGWLGVRLPVRALVNQLAVTERLPPVMRTVIGVASGLLSLKQFGNGTAVVGGGWQAAGDRERGGVALLPGRLVGNLRLACHAIPALRGARLVRTWAGLEAETRDALPAVGPLPGHPGAFVCGSVHSGFTSGPWIAKLLADRILGREPAMPLFPPDRLIVRPNRGSET